MLFPEGHLLGLLRKPKLWPHNFQEAGLENWNRDQTSFEELDLTTETVTKQFWEAQLHNKNCDRTISRTEAWQRKLWSNNFG
jgi:hypothetical protein